MTPSRSASRGVAVRTEQPADFPAIHDLVHKAFGREFEADLVDRLRATGAYLPDLALVAELDGMLVGHVMITGLSIAADCGGLSIAADCGGPIASSLLAPLAVLPGYQNRGIGGQLTKAAMDRAQELGHGSMILIGHPDYYPRFGFQPASRWGLRYAAPVPDEVFMAIELLPGALTDAAGVVTLGPEFAEAD